MLNSRARVWGFTFCKQGGFRVNCLTKDADAEAGWRALGAPAETPPDSSAACAHHERGVDTRHVARDPPSVLRASLDERVPSLEYRLGLLEDHNTLTRQDRDDVHAVRLVHPGVSVVVHVRLSGAGRSHGSLVTAGVVLPR